MNGPPTPSDPLGLLIYGAAMLLVWGGFRLLDRRREKKLQTTAEEAKQQAKVAAGHASTARDSAEIAAARSSSRASGKQAEEILQNGHDANAALVRIAMTLGEVRADVRRLSGLPERVAQLEKHLDDLVLPATARRRHEQ